MDHGKVTVLIEAMVIRQKDLVVMFFGQGEQAEWAKLLGPLYEMGRMVEAGTWEVMAYETWRVSTHKRGFGLKHAVDFELVRDVAIRRLQEIGAISAGSSLGPGCIEWLGTCEDAPWFQARAVGVWGVDCGLPEVE